MCFLWPPLLRGPATGRSVSDGIGSVCLHGYVVTALKHKGKFYWSLGWSKLENNAITRIASARVYCTIVPDRNHRIRLVFCAVTHYEKSITTALLSSLHWPCMTPRWLLTTRMNSYIVYCVRILLSSLRCDCALILCYCYCYCNGHGTYVATACTVGRTLGRNTVV